jgi:sec-independent protein translocase protein TatC
MKTSRFKGGGMPEEFEDDLFRKSTMSFGEHLDELRAALVRSALGLTVALFIAWPFADNLVLFVEQPLTRALGRLDQARGKILWENLNAENAALADLQRLDGDRLIPRRLRIDPAALRDALGMETTTATKDGPPQVGAPSPWSDTTWRTAENAAKLLVDQARAEGSHPGTRALWETLTDDERQRLEELAQRTDWTLRESTELSALLGTIVHRTDLRTIPDVWELRSKLPGLQLQLLERIRDAQATPRRVDRNVLLLHATFPSVIPLPGPPNVEITVWEPSTARLQSLNAPEPFMIWMKALFVLAAVIASPWIFYQLWNFVASGLYRHERKLVHVFLPVSLGLFFAGASLAFFFVFDPVLDFLLSFNLKMNIDMQPRVSDWMGFVLLLPLGFGISFQLPLVMLVLERLGLVTVQTFLSHWRTAVMIIFVVSSVLTPADPMSLIFMAIPLTFLYFAGIWFCRFNHPRQSPLGAASDP